ncbi:MAG: hypothetical protein JWN95_306 [Frankiales bacterium]|nr:hypothetical protein [Frankiales bacterium]
MTGVIHLDFSTGLIDRSAAYVPDTLPPPCPAWCTKPDHSARWDDVDFNDGDILLEHICTHSVPFDAHPSIDPCIEVSRIVRLTAEHGLAIGPAEVNVCGDLTTSRDPRDMLMIAAELIAASRLAQSGA